MVMVSLLIGKRTPSYFEAYRLRVLLANVQDVRVEVLRHAVHRETRVSEGRRHCGESGLRSRTIFLGDYLLPARTVNT